MNKIITLIVASMLVGCATCKPIEKLVYKDKLVPIVVVPEPDKIEKPILEIDQLSEEQKNNLGELAKAYVISVHQLEEYSKQQNIIIDKYFDMSKNNPK